MHEWCIMNGGSEARSTRRLCPPVRPPHGEVLPGSAAPRTVEHPFQVAVLGFLEVVMLEEKQGRGVNPTSALKKKITSARGVVCVLASRVRVTPLVGGSQQRTWCLSPAPAPTPTVTRIQRSARPQLPVHTPQLLVYALPSVRDCVSERVEPGVADDEAAGCVRAGRAWRRQRDPVLQDRGGTWRYRRKKTIKSTQY